MKRTAYLVVALALSGCSPYWVKNDLAVAELSVVEVDTVLCNGRTSEGLLACADYGGYIQIKKGLPEHIKSCALAHERKHLAGWSHRPGAAMAIDCGDGRIMPL